MCFHSHYYGCIEPINENVKEAQSLSICLTKQFGGKFKSSNGAWYIHANKETQHSYPIGSIVPTDCCTSGNAQMVDKWNTIGNFSLGLQQTSPRELAFFRALPNPGIFQVCRITTKILY